MTGARPGSGDAVAAGTNEEFVVKLATAQLGMRTPLPGWDPSAIARLSSQGGKLEDCKAIDALLDLVESVPAGLGGKVA